MFRPLAERHSARFVIPRAFDLFKRDVSGFTQVTVDENRVCYIQHKDMIWIGATESLIKDGKFKIKITFHENDFTKISK